MTDKIVVLTTCETEAEAQRIAEALVNERLAACVNIVAGVRSVYRWKGEVEKAGEVLLLVKTSRELFRQVQATIERTHSYELPELVAVPIVDGSARYLDWLAAGLKQDEQRPR
jgi:periplasmic divalent cation tolerance protein